MAKSKKNANINLATISTEAVALLSAYNVADNKIIALKSAHKVAVDAKNAERDALMAELKEGEYTLTPEKKAEIEKNLSIISMDIMELDKSFKEDCKPYNKAMRQALAFVPENIYTHYENAWTTGNDANFNCAIREFLRAVGIGVRDNIELANFGNVMKVRCSGSRNASAKKRAEDGNRLATKSERQFGNTFMKAFLDYAINAKKVLVEGADYTITKKDFSATAEVTAETTEERA